MRSEKMSEPMNTGSQKIDAASVLRGMVTLLPESTEDDREFLFNDPESEREFLITRLENADGIRFYVQEMTPNGRLVETDDDGNVKKAWEEPRIRAIERRQGPNGLLRACKAVGIDAQAMVCCGAGFSIDSRYLDSLEACAQEIAKSIEGNVRYESLRELSDEEKASLGHQEKVSSAAYWEHRAACAARAMETEQGLFKGCHSLSGAPVADEHKKRILAYLNAPSQEEWLEIRGLHITGGGTLWQAWGAVDPRAPRSGNVGHPTPETLRQAIRHAVEANIERIEDEVRGHGSPRPRQV